MTHVDIRPMRTDDAAVCARLTYDAFAEMRTRYHLPVEEWRPEEAVRQERRLARLVETDPDGCFVAEAGEGIVGIAEAIVRDGLWHLSMLAVAPGWQDRGVGRDLLDHTLAYGSGGPGMILASRDPKATRRYALAGFDIHPAMTAWGPVDAARVPPAPDVRPGVLADLELVATIDREVRGASRAIDVRALAEEEGADLLVIDGRGWVAVFGTRPYALAAVDEDAARQLLAAALARLPAGENVEVGWLTAGQGWAIDVVLAARIELHPVGPFLTRGVPGPFSPCLACGAFG